MKKNVLFSLLAVAVVGVMIMVSSCSKNEEFPVPEEVEDVVASEYYISGIVTESGSVLSGVAVSSGDATATTDTDGTYTLTVETVGSLSVTFEKDDYVTISATAVFADDVSAGSTVFLLQAMSKTRTSTEVTSSGTTIDVTIDESESATTENTLTVVIPENALTETTDITITPISVALSTTFVEEESSTGMASLFSMNCTPSGTTFETPITVSLPSSDSDYYFTDMQHYVQDGSEWVYVDDATFDSTSGAYQISMSSFSNHTFVAEISSVSVTSIDELSSEEYDNLGTTKSTTEDFTYDAKQGCEVISKSTTSDIADELATMAITQLGASSSVSTISLTNTINIAGDTYVTVVASQEVIDYTFTAQAKSSSTGADAADVSVTIRYYGNTYLDTDVETGDFRPDHNN